MGMQMELQRNFIWVIYTEANYYKETNSWFAPIHYPVGGACEQDQITIEKLRIYIYFAHLIIVWEYLWSCDY